jgi:hypothetical protein
VRCRRASRCERAQGRLTKLSRLPHPHKLVSIETGITASGAARRSGSAMSNGPSWFTRLPRRSILSCRKHLRAYICRCATKRAGSNRRSAPMTTASTAIPNCRLKIGTKDTGCGSSDVLWLGPGSARPTLHDRLADNRCCRRHPFGRAQTHPRAARVSSGDSRGKG